MSNWTKLPFAGVLIVDAGKVLEIITQAAGAQPATTDSPTASVRGPTAYNAQFASGTDFYYRTQDAAAADALVGADPTLDTFAEIKARIVDIESEVASRVASNRSIATTGLLTGGGDLSAERTFDVPKASQAAAEAGTDNATAMTPLRTFEAMAAFIAALPTSDPAVAGKAWLNNGVLTVSAG